MDRDDWGSLVIAMGIISIVILLAVVIGLSNDLNACREDYGFSWSFQESMVDECIAKGEDGYIISKDLVTGNYFTDCGAMSENSDYKWVYPKQRIEEFSPASEEIQSDEEPVFGCGDCNFVVVMEYLPNDNASKPVECMEYGERSDCVRWFGISCAEWETEKYCLHWMELS